MAHVRDNYEGGLCPDCDEPIPDEADDGVDCDNCGHAFFFPALRESLVRDPRQRTGTAPWDTAYVRLVRINSPQIISLELGEASAGPSQAQAE
jgi:DNA-directed RNA polymerase subunit RPC12/RpoP